MFTDSILFNVVIKMNKEYSSKFPQWYMEDLTNYVSCLSDDLDSLVGCSLLEKVKGVEIGYFYNFKELYRGTERDVKAIGVDIALEKGRTFDNHVTMLNHKDRYNEMSINPNNIDNVSRDNYTDKYALSTALLIWSMYDLELPSTDEGKMILLSIDSAFLGHYNDKFKPIQNKYLLKLGFEELIDLQERYSLDDFRSVQRKYRMNSKIVMIDGKLRTTLPFKEISDVLGLELILPHNNFLVNNKLKISSEALDNTTGYSKDSIESGQTKIFSLALTGKNYISKTNIRKVG